MAPTEAGYELERAQSRIDGGAHDMQDHGRRRRKEPCIGRGDFRSASQLGKAKGTSGERNRAQQEQSGELEMTARPERGVRLPEVLEPVSDLGEHGPEEILVAAAHVGDGDVECDAGRGERADRERDEADPPAFRDRREERGRECQPEDRPHLGPPGGRVLELEPGERDEHRRGGDEHRGADGVTQRPPLR